MTLEDCLPPDLQGPTTTLTPIVVGLSGAGVHRVEAAGQSFVLKIAATSESADQWRRTLAIQRLAADAGLAPRVVHVDEARRAVLSAFVADRGFIGYYRDPGTHEAALTSLGRTVRRIHALPIPADAPERDPHEFLDQLVKGPLAGFPLPTFVRERLSQVLTDEPRTGRPALVLGHNDLNPSNLVYGGQDIQMVDWAAAGPTEPCYDLGVLSVFLRMDEATSLRLLSAYEGSSLAVLPERFVFVRRLAASLAAAFQLVLARQWKHPGSDGTETLETTLPLAGFYQRLREGVLQLGTAQGQWAFGLALIGESLAL